MSENVRKLRKKILRMWENEEKLKMPQNTEKGRKWRRNAENGVNEDRNRWKCWKWGKMKTENGRKWRKMMKLG